MSTEAFRIILENLSEGARSPEPGAGRGRATDADAAEVRSVVGAFAALPADAAEDADSRIILAASGRRLTLRHAGRRLILEEDGVFANASVEDVIARLLAPPAPGARAAESGGPGTPQSGRPRDFRKSWYLAALVAFLAALCWWEARPGTPDGVEWEDDGVSRQAILASAAGGYHNDDGGFWVDAKGSSLVSMDKSGVATMRTALRVGHRRGVPVLVTNAGVVFEIPNDDTIQTAGAEYKRVAQAR